MIVDLIRHFPLTENVMLRWTRHGLMLAAFSCVLAVSSIRAQDASVLHARAETFRQAGLSDATGGHIDDAIATFKKGLAIEPANAALLDALGAAYSLKGELETAKKYLVESLEANPDSITTRQNLGIVLFTLEDYEGANRQFAKLQDVPGRPRAIASLFLGLIAQRHSDCVKAIRLIGASGDLVFQYPDALLSYAECEYQQGNAIRARQVLEGFDKLPGSTPQQHQQAASLYARLGRAHSRQDAPEAQSRDNHETDSVLRQAAALEKANHLEEAQKLLQESTARQPVFDVLFELAEVAKQRGDVAMAMKSLKQAAEIEPGRDDSYLEFSTICADHGNDQLALATAEIGLDHVPDSYRLTVQKGVVEEKLGDLNEAEETLKKATGMQKDNSIALLSLAIVQAHSGRPVEAEETLVSAIRQFPDNYYMYYFRGKLLLQVGDARTDMTERRNAAQRSLEKAIQLNPRYADSYYQISQIYMETSPTMAERALRKCLQLDPTHIPAQYALARLLVRTGRRTDGQAMFARLKGQQRAEEMEQQKQLRIDVAQY